MPPKKRLRVEKGQCLLGNFFTQNKEPQRVSAHVCTSDNTDRDGDKQLSEPTITDADVDTDTDRSLCTESETGVAVSPEEISESGCISQSYMNVPANLDSRPPVTSKPSTSTSLDTAPGKPKVDNESQPAKRKLVPAWFKLYPWLQYDQERQLMSCSVCLADKVAKNSFTRGCSNFRKSSLDDHVKTQDHIDALKTPVHRANQAQAEIIQLTNEENAIAQAAKAVHWLVAEDLPLAKFPSMMGLLKEYKVEDIEKLEMSESVSYSSRKTAMDLLETFADDVDEQANRDLAESPFVSVLADETTDIAVKKRMGMYVKIVNKDMVPNTRFLTNIHIENGTGETMAKAILDEMNSRKVQSSKIVALGSDGAAAMTGRDRGVTGRLSRENPHMVNVHCIAHRLALCTSQAANNVPAMQSFQETLTTLFYYFKGSANRVEALSQLQDLLDSPQLKIKEIHSVRWLSFYIALDTVFRSLDPLLTYLQGTDRRRDPKAVGLQKKIACEKFITLAHFLMDVIPVVTALNQFFQKKFIDLGLIKVMVNQCISDLMAQKTDPGQHRALLTQHLTRDGGGIKYKGHEVSGCREGEVASAVNKFIDNLVDNIRTRFPDTEIMSAFGCLAMRPISFYTGDELKNWGTEDLERLMDHFGQEKEITWTDEDGNKYQKKSAPLVDSTASKKEWSSLKDTVIAQQYPRDNFACLWQLIARFHQESFPNLLKLAQIALVLPVHTADVERGFSSQNNILIPKRNRLNVETQNMLLKQRLEGQGERSGAYIGRIVRQWKKKKDRKLFNHTEK